MKIKNISDLKKSINKSTMIIFIAIFCSVLTGLNITHNKFKAKRAHLSEQEIKSAGEIFKSNLSEKLSIIASSTVFLDFLRSGEITRSNLYPELLGQISSLKAKTISGMEILGENNQKIFTHGEQSPYFVILKLCYMNQTLDFNIGDCRFNWKLYFNINELSRAIPTINKSIQLGKNKSRIYNFINNNHFGSFSVLKSADIKLPFFIANEKDYFYYIDLFLVVTTLILLCSWSWYRLSSLLNNYISTPIYNLAYCLKSDTPLEKQDNIEEIQSLIDEINQWKFKIKKAQSLENADKLANIAAQLAHDVRSPLSAIDMLVKSINDIPENLRIALHNATRRISDISNNFLAQYKKPTNQLQVSSSSNEHIPSLLESIISEKRNQYIRRDIEIKLAIFDNAWDVFAHINSVDFKRVISNLVNNSVEAIDVTGTININLINQNSLLKIEISDDGTGIPENILQRIIDEGISVGKNNGSGLGLSHAINKIQSWNGKIDLKSEFGKGTRVEINLPISNKIPEWFRRSLTISPLNTICILDDEAYTHNLWIHKFNNLDLKPDSIKNFYCTSDAKLNLSIAGIENTLFFIDYDLSNDPLSGLDFIVKFNLQNQATLVTNRYDDSDLQNKCIDLGIKILPKNLIPYIPINY